MLVVQEVGDEDDRPIEDTALQPGGDEHRETASWRERSALGAVGTGVARGFHAVFAPPVDEVVIVASVPGDPPDADQRVRVILDPDDPTKSVAILPGQSPEPPAD